MQDIVWIVFRFIKMTKSTRYFLENLFLCTRPIVHLRFKKLFQNLHQKSPPIRNFFNHFRCWLSCAVSGVCFDADENWIHSRLRSLHRRCKFEAVRGNDTIIVICGRHHRRWIRCVLLDVVQRRIRE
jgi:hypothetical protein